MKGVSVVFLLSVVFAATTTLAVVPVTSSSSVSASPPASTTITTTIPPPSPTTTSTILTDVATTTTVAPTTVSSTIAPTTTVSVAPTTVSQAINPNTQTQVVLTPQSTNISPTSSAMPMSTASANTNGAIGISSGLSIALICVGCALALGLLAICVFRYYLRPSSAFRERLDFTNPGSRPQPMIQRDESAATVYSDRDHIGGDKMADPNPAIISVQPNYYPQPHQGQYGYNGGYNQYSYDAGYVPEAQGEGYTTDYIGHYVDQPQYANPQYAFHGQQGFVNGEADHSQQYTQAEWTEYNTLQHQQMAAIAAVQELQSSVVNGSTGDPSEGKRISENSDLNRTLPRPPATKRVSNVYSATISDRDCQVEMLPQDSAKVSLDFRK